MDGMLSQEEINALLGNVNIDDSDSSSTEVKDDTSLSDTERDALGEISNISMGTAATTLSSLVNNRVVITTPQVSYVTADDVVKQNERPCVFIHISYISGLEGKNVLILKEEDVRIITDLMMGGDGTNISGELTELHLSAISEAMNQMMGSAATSMSSMIDTKVDISPPVASVVDLNDRSVIDDSLKSFFNEDLVQVSFKMVIGDLVNSQIMQLFPVGFARAMYKKFYQSSGGDIENEQSVEPMEEIKVEAPVQEMATQQQSFNDNGIMGSQINMGQGVVGGQPMMDQAMMGQQFAGQPIAGQTMGMPYTMPQQNINIQPAQFQSFSQPVINAVQPENIDLIMDVPLEVTVELGRANKSIKEILDFSPGTIIELNKLAGEPIDVLVNGKFVAKGEVVVIEESFGIRVTEIIKE